MVDFHRPSLCQQRNETRIQKRRENCLKGVGCRRQGGRRKELDRCRFVCSESLPLQCPAVGLPFHSHDSTDHIMSVVIPWGPCLLPFGNLSSRTVKVRRVIVNPFSAHLFFHSSVECHTATCPSRVFVASLTFFYFFSSNIRQTSSFLFVDQHGSYQANCPQVHWGKGPS